MQILKTGEYHLGIVTIWWMMSNFIYKYYIKWKEKKKWCQIFVTLRVDQGEEETQAWQDEMDQR